jgi:effector-binding domain-containing protein
MFSANLFKQAGRALFALAIGSSWAAGPAFSAVSLADRTSAAFSPADDNRTVVVQTTPEASPSPPVADPNKPSGDASTGFGLTVMAKPVVMLQGSSTWEEGYHHIMDAFKTLQTEAAKAGLKSAGRPMTVFVETDDMGFRYQAMLPIENAPEGRDALSAEVKFGRSPAGKALKFQHRGAYDDIDSTYEAITAYLDEKGLEAQNLFIEEYLNDVKGSDDTALEVDIYVFVK